MKNFNYKQALLCLFILSVLVTSFTLVGAFLPRWCLWCSVAAFIAFCVWLVGRAEWHYWYYVIDRRDKTEAGVAKSPRPCFPLADVLGKVNDADSISVIPISAEDYDTLWKRLDEADGNATD